MREKEREIALKECKTEINENKDGSSSSRTYFYTLVSSLYFCLMLPLYYSTLCF